MQQRRSIHLHTILLLRCKTKTKNGFLLRSQVHKRYLIEPVFKLRKAKYAHHNPSAQTDRMHNRVFKARLRLTNAGWHGGPKDPEAAETQSFHCVH